MRLTHEGHHSVLLKPFEQDSFSGDWTTKSIGCARDFNLMLGQGCEGSLEAMRIAKGMNIKAAANPPNIVFMNSVDAFYCADGGANVTINGNESYTLYEGDLMVVNRQEHDEHSSISFGCTSQVDTAIIRARITY